MCLFCFRGQLVVSCVAACSMVCWALPMVGQINLKGALAHRPLQIQCPKSKSGSTQPQKIRDQINEIPTPAWEYDRLSPFHRKSKKKSKNHRDWPSIPTKSSRRPSFSQRNQGRHPPHTEQNGVQQNVQPLIHPPVVRTKLTPWHAVQRDHNHSHGHQWTVPTPRSNGTGISRPPGHTPRPSANLRGLHLRPT